MTKILENDLRKCRSFQAGLDTFYRHTEKFGVRDIVYGFMATPNAYVRHAHVMATTLPDRLMEIYFDDGGVNRDPVAENAGAMTVPLFFDLKGLSEHGSNDKFAQGRYIRALLDDGYTSFWSIPFSDLEEHGVGAITFFQEARSARPAIDPHILKQYALLFHRTMKDHGHLAGLLGLSEKEKNCLLNMAAGASAAEIAELHNVTPRTVENWIQSARRKMKSKTSSEATHKATCFGVLNRNR